MARRFIELYLDEDVDTLIATLARARGFTAETTVAAGNRAAGDEQQLVYAAERGLTLLTHNRAHFEQLANVWLGSGVRTPEFSSPCAARPRHGPTAVLAPEHGDRRRDGESIVVLLSFGRRAAKSRTMLEQPTEPP